MIEKNSDEIGHNILLVSRTGIIGFIVFSLVMTSLLMALFMFVDFGSIFGLSNLALKVGQTSISMKDFKKIQEISGERAKQMTEQAFAQELLETLLLAENGRNLLLDQREEFKQKIQAFDSALNKSDDEERIARSIFLIEELAKASLEQTLKDSPEIATVSHLDSSQAMNEQVKLHLRTISASNPSRATEIMTAIASGTPFEEINSSWSTSLYKGVGGDLGWKTEKDLPEGVFSKLMNSATGHIIEGFADESGIHFFEVLGKHKTRKNYNETAEIEKKSKASKRKIISRHIVHLKNRIYHWMNPALRVKRQINVNLKKETN